ncbi:hypothetical protein [Arthrobacter sp. NyZ413]|uniref:hypothetical protein n=1 Tax=Arthrobacter sp. NyZ413 TaxID=3144669 RepID=UPI003BF8F130
MANPGTSPDPFGFDLQQNAGVQQCEQVQQLARRAVVSADQVDAALAKLAQLQLEQWESPAGRAYRATLAVQSVSLRRGLDSLRDAAAATFQHAQDIASSGDGL